MRRKILVLDIDGTLTNGEKKITQKTRESILEAQKQGHIVVLASGRPDGGMKPYEEELELGRYGGYLLPFNGARIIECSTGKVLHQELLPPQMIPDLCDYIRDKECGLMTYSDEAILSARIPDEYIELDTRVNRIPAIVMDDFLECMNLSINKCLVTARPQLAEQYEKELAIHYAGRAMVFRSEPFYVEIMPQGVDKATALERMLQILGLCREDMICCGDGYNDVSMIRYAGLGVAMGNAREPVKEAADYITGTNEEDGVAQVVRKFMLKGESYEN